MFSAVAAGISLSALVASCAESYIAKIVGRCAGASVRLWRDHKLNALVRKTIDEEVGRIDLEEGTRDIFVSANRDYEPVREGFFASILKLDLNGDEAWFVTVPPCARSNLDGVHSDLLLMLNGIRERLWKDDKFRRLAGDKRVQQYLADEIDSIKVQIRAIIKRVEGIEYELQRIKSLLNTRRFTVVENVADPVGNFVGRRDLLDEMDSKFGSNRVLFLTGFGGVGKSELSKKYAKEFRDRSEANKAIWLNYSGSIRDTIAKGVKFRDIDDRIFADDVDRLFEAKMAALSYERDLLVIIDNYEWGLDIEDLSGIQCRVILTGRYERIPPRFKSLKVDSLPPESAWELIRISVPEDRSAWLDANKEEISSILEAIGYHTLTVSLIAGLICSDIPAEELNLRGRLFDVSDDKVFSSKDDAVTYESIMDHISNLFRTYSLTETQRDVLRILSMLSVEGINERLFRELSGIDYDVISGMGRLNLVSRATVNMEGRISIHPLIKELVCTDEPILSMLEKSPVCGSFIERFDRWLKKAKKTLMPLELGGYEYMIRPMGRTIASDPLLKEQPKLQGNVLTIAYTYNYLGNCTEALEYASFVMSIRERDLAPDHVDLGNIYYDMGFFNGKAGRYKTSLEFYLNAFSIFTKRLPPDHPDLSNTYNAIGTAYTQLGRDQESLEYYLKALEIRLKSLPKDHEYLANSYNNLGAAYANLGRHRESLESYLKALEIRERTLPENHPSIASLCTNIGDVYEDMGAGVEALDYKMRGLRIREKALPPDHPELAESYSSIGRSYSLQGRYQEALDYKNRALEIREKALPPDHPQLAYSYDSIAATYHKLKEHEKALGYYVKAMEIRERSLPENHPLLSKSYRHVGGAYYYVGMYENALEYEKKHLRIEESRMPPNLPVLAESYHSISNIMKKIGRPAEAVEYSIKELETMKRQSPPDYTGIAELCVDIGKDYAEMGEHQAAIDHFLSALSVEEKSAAPDGRDLADTYRLIAVSYSALGMYQEAVGYRKKALEISENDDILDEPDLARQYYNIGVLYVRMGAYDDALPYLLKSLKIREEILPPDHPDLIKMYYTIGAVYSANKNVTEAIRYLERTIELIRDTASESDPRIQNCIDMMDELRRME